MIDKEKFDKTYKPDYSQLPENIKDTTLEQYKYMVEKLYMSGKMIGEYFNSWYYDKLREKFKGQVVINKKESTRRSNLYFYGTEHTAQLYSTKEKYKKSMIEKYGIDTPLKNKNLMKESMVKKYGVEYYNQSQEGKKHISEIWQNKSEEEKQQSVNKKFETIKNKYGSLDNYFNEVNKRIEKTNTKKYGVKRFSSTNEFKQSMSDLWSNQEFKNGISNKQKEIWQNKSDKERLLIKNKIHNSWEGKSEEELNEIYEKIKQSWNNKSEEELNEIYEKIGNSNKESWNNKSEEEKLKISNTMREVWKNKSEDDKKKIISQLKEGHKLFWQNKSEGNKKEYSEKLSKLLKNIWQNKSDEELKSYSEKIKEIWHNKSEEELKEFSEKLSKSLKQSWSNKSELSKLEQINKNRVNGISFEQYQTLNNKDKFKQYLVGYKDMNGGYPTPDNLKEYFKFSNTSGVLLYIHQYNLEDYVLWGRSSPEQEVYDHIRSIYDGEVVRNDRKVLGDKELDIYIPEKNLAIEFDGCYWHSKLWKDNHYHQNKSKECLSKNIRLIHIYEDEWIYKQDIVKDIIKSALGVFENKIYARDCIIKKVDKQTYKNMCQYHLQGYSPAQIILGLYYQDQLIQLASFSKSRYDKNYEYEWIRGVQLPGYQIIGGTSKLFKYFINNYNPESIICYSDFNKFSGNSYKNCGFTLDKITTPDMWFNEINGLKRINRQPSKHQLTKSLVESGDLLEMHGAGNMKWVWRKNNDR